MPHDVLPTTRRGLLAAVGGAFSVGTAGAALGSDADTDRPSDARSRPDWEQAPQTASGWHVRPGHAPFSVPEEPPCPDRGTSDLPDVAWGSIAGWELRVDRVRVGRGDTLRVRLRNASGERRKRLSDAYWHLETYTADGWHDGTGSALRPSNLVIVDPGEVHEWTVELSTTDLFQHGCTDLQAGRYRFVYTGLQETETPIAAGFDLLDGGWLLTGAVTEGG